ncbi:hypothetical protein ElyMa_005548000 [Elysia marginata]|uniref:Uncharacterized protein n=1 Tax=Elysia marginata TaxID=1093978 RepID=A0AAV4EZR1_9GAST|nr:hypothetical protein ElyMa_005548000 [Elysia marginata]
MLVYSAIPVGVGVHSVFGYPALGVIRGERDFVRVLPVDVVLLRPEDVHAVAERLLAEESLFVLFMPYMILHNILSHTLGLLDIMPSSLEYRVHLWPQPYVLLDYAAGALILHFA